MIQSAPTRSITKIVTLIKSITAREIFRICREVKNKLWGGEFWKDGYFASTVGKYGDENMIGKYIKNRGKEYKKIYEDKKLSLILGYKLNTPLLASGVVYSL